MSNISATSQRDVTSLPAPIRRGMKLSKLLSTKEYSMAFRPLKDPLKSERDDLRRCLCAVYLALDNNIVFDRIKEEEAKFELLEPGQILVAKFGCASWYEEKDCVFTAIFRVFRWKKNDVKTEAELSHVRMDASLLPPYKDREPFSEEEMNCIFSYYYYRKLSSGGIGILGWLDFTVQNEENKDAVLSKKPKELPERTTLLTAPVLASEEKHDSSPVQIDHIDVGNMTQHNCDTAISGSLEAVSEGVLQNHSMFSGLVRIWKMLPCFNQWRYRFGTFFDIAE